MQLVTNTVPNYGSCNIFEKLLFESYQKCVKASVSLNITMNAVLYAMKCVMLTHWLHCLSSTLASAKIFDDDVSFVFLAKNVVIMN